MLFEISSLRLMADNIGIRTINLGDQGGRIVFRENSKADSAALMKLLHTHPAMYQLSGPCKLMIREGEETGQERVERARELLVRLTPSEGN